jgi:sugar phosphate permease
METGLNERKRRKGLIGYENRVLILMCFAFGFVFFDRLAISVLFPFMQEEMPYLNNTSLGTLSAALAITWSLSAPTLGLAAAKVKKVVPFFAVLILAFSVTSFAAGLVTTFGVLLALRAIMGFIEGPVMPLCQGFMFAESSEKRRGFNMGLLQTTSASLLASTLGPIVLVSIATATNWRFGFYFTIIPGVLVGVFSFIFLDEPKKMKNPLEKASEQAQASYEAEKNKPEEKTSFRELLKYRNIWICLFCSCAMVSWYILSITFAPTYFANTLKMEPGAMATMVMSLGVGGMVWGVLGPLWSGYIGRKPMVIVSCFVSIISPILMIKGYGVLPVALLFILIVITHEGQGGHVALFSIIPSETVPQKLGPAAIGFVMGTGEMVGGVIMPIVAGRLADTVSPEMPFILCSICAVIGGVLAFFLKETAPNKVRQQLEASGGGV